ncbi:hypothetical protein F5Y19DRAFT_459246 [Xylariaceae sp. FL1651]|nr:hypothetical protein F5Y19DRAFT_459246 [Xylariaceae sp. FL1651]
MGVKRQSSTEGTASKKTKEHPPSGTTPKRRRVSRACDQCRAAREKCDGIQPLCFPCASQNRSCSWEEPKKKRGVQTGYIRTLEVALGWIFDKFPESEEALHGLLTHEGGQGRLLLAGRDSTSTGTRLYRRWRRSTVHTEIERVLSGSDTAYARSANDSTPGDESDEDVPERRDLESSPNIDPTAPLKNESERLSLPQRRPQPHQDSSASRAYTTNLPQESLAHSQPPPQRQDTCALPPNHWRLLDIYFSYTHVWFPILEKHEVLKTGYAYPDEGLHISRDASSSAGHAELWAALALASFQDTASKTDQSVEAVSSASARMEPRAIYQIARNLIPLEHGVFEIRHINAILLLTLVNMACNDLKAAWILIGMASRIALSLRLHEASASTQSRQSSHAYMGCCILDTLLSAQLTLLPHLRPGAAQIHLPRLDNDLDEWQPWMPCVGFGHPQQNGRPSRMPSHSVSSFGILHRIHVVLSRRLWDDHGASPQSEETFLTALHDAVSQYGAEKYLTSCILTGECMTSQLPSVHLLRLAYLSAASRCKSFPFLHRTVLSCVEGYINNFGTCGLPPLFSVLIKLLDQQSQNELFEDEEIERWKEVERAMEFVWTTSDQNCTPITGVDNIHSMPYSQQSRNSHIMTANMRLQQTSASTLFHPNSAVSPNSTNIDNMFSQNHNTNMLDFASIQPPSENHTHHLNVAPNTISDVEDMEISTIPPPVQFSTSARPSFSGAALDYDTILDDIASIERTNLAESDPQFMANLGLRPGTNLADVFSHEFMGFS